VANSSGDAQQSAEPGVLSVDDAIRALIRTEFGLEKPKVEPHTSGVDAIMLALLTLNVALVFSLVPKAVLEEFKSGWFSLLSDKVLPWIASGVFVAGYTWWKDQVLRTLHLRGFRVVNVTVAVLLIISQVPLIPLEIRLSPQNAELWLDGNRVQRSSGHWASDNVYEYDVNLRFQSHDFDVKPPQDWHTKDPEAMEQSFHFSLKRMFGVVTSSHPEELSIVWPVTITAPRPDVGPLTISRKGPFGTDFMNISGTRGYGLRPVGASSTTDHATLSSLGRSQTKKIYLPAGEYDIASKVGMCKGSLTISNELVQDQYRVDLQCGK
jgi:hypothetical protein